MAVRAALGAGRARLLRQLLTEVLALFLLGAFGGFVVALFATAALERLPLPGTVPISLELSPDLRVLAFALGISLAGGPGLRPRPGAARGADGHRVATARRLARQRQLSRVPDAAALIIGQLALSLVLLVAAGLFMRALDSGQRIDPGFETRAWRRRCSSRSRGATTRRGRARSIARCANGSRRCPASAPSPTPAACRS